MDGGGGSEIGGIGPGDEFSSTTGLRASINHDGRHCPTAAMGAAPRAKAYNNQQTYYATGLCY